MRREILTSPSLTLSDDLVQVEGPGLGSTGTHTRTFSTGAITNRGSSIQYEPDATSGDTFTIGQAGVYSVVYIEFSDISETVGITLNASATTVSYAGLPVARQIAGGHTGGSRLYAFAATMRLESGDILRATTGGSNDGNSNSVFRVERLY